MLAAFLIQTSEEGDGRRQELDRLLLQVGRGDREAFTQLYNLVRGAVYAMALSLLGDAQEAQDAAQDTFVKVWESAPDYRPQGSSMAWMLTIARNQARSRLRQSGRQVLLDEEAWNTLPAGLSSIPDEDRLVLQEALARLGSEDRQIVLLHAVTGLKHREIAVLLGLPLSTVLSKYHRGLKKLKSLMKGENGQ